MPAGPQGMGRWRELSGQGKYQRPSDRVAGLRVITAEGAPFSATPPETAMDAGNVSLSIPFSPSLAEPGMIHQGTMGAQA